MLEAEVNRLYVSRCHVLTIRDEFSVLSEREYWRCIYLGHGRLRVQHEVLEGSFKHPT